ncbi:hypothetical protein [Rossellomorea marisflavi]|uniref:hypothetical protein n=1 Tax=Rossellomorea marisflavi TaxID=189381 RepID=UPI003FA0197B
MTTIETSVFTSEAHRERFEELMKEQMVLRSKIFKSQMAFLYVISAIEYPFAKDMFHQRGMYPELDKMMTLRAEGVISDKDALLYAMAVNVFNGTDIFKEMRLEGNPSPYTFFCKLGSEARILGEASIIFSEGFDLTTIS